MENNINKNFNGSNHEKPKHEVGERKNREFGFFDPFFDGFFRFPSFKEEFKELDKVMKTDVKEEENGYALEIEMPGFDKEDVKLELNNGYLSIEAKHNSNNDEKDAKGNYIRRERYYGSCARSFYVGDVKEDDIEASLEKGILHVHIPKEKQPEKKRIEIK